MKTKFKIGEFTVKLKSLSQEEQQQHGLNTKQTVDIDIFDAKQNLVTGSYVSAKTMIELLGELVFQTTQKETENDT